MEMEDYKKYEPIFGSWYLKKEIGRGSFGTVYEIRKESYGGAVNKSALKIISVDHNDEETLKKVLNEKQYNKYLQMLDLTAKNTAERMMDETTATR